VFLRAEVTDHLTHLRQCLAAARFHRGERLLRAARIDGDQVTTRRGGGGHYSKPVAQKMSEIPGHPDPVSGNRESGGLLALLTQLVVPHPESSGGLPPGSHQQAGDDRACHRRQSGNRIPRSVELPP
jgi:hypothetical protein